MWLKSTRFPLLIACLIVLATVTYLWTHPRLIAPFASRLISRNLLQDLDGSVRFQNFYWRQGQGLDLYKVSVSLQGEGGALTLISADTLSVEYRIREIFTARPRVRKAIVKGVAVYGIGGKPTHKKKKTVIHWPYLQIDLLEILDASVEISGSDGRLLERIPQVSWRGSIQADADTLRVECRDAEVWWETRDSRINSVYGLVMVDDNGIGVRNLHGHLNESDVMLTGRRDWDGDLDLDVQGTRLEVEEVQNLTGISLDFAAAGDLDAFFRTSGDTLFFDGVFSGVLESYNLEEVHGRAIILPEEIRWRELDGRVNSALFRGHGHIDLARPQGVAFTLEGNVADVDLSLDLVPEEEVELPATQGFGRVTIFHSDIPEETHVTGFLKDGFVATIPFDSCYADVFVDADGVTFQAIDLVYHGQSANLTGHIDTTQAFQGRLALDLPDLNRLPPEWHLPPLRGSVVGEGDLMGQDERLTFVGPVYLTEAALPPLSVATAQVELVVGDILGEPRISLEAKGAGLLAGNVPLGEFDVQGEVSSLGARVELFRSILGDTVVTFVGQADFVDGAAAVSLVGLAVDLEGSHWRMAEPAGFNVGADGITLSKFHLASERGNLTVRDLDTRGEFLSGTLLLNNFDLGLVNPFLPDTTRINGSATAEVHLAGTSHEPLVNVTANIVSSEFDLARVDSLHVDLRFGRGSLDLNRLLLVSNYGQMLVRGKIEHPNVPLVDFWPQAQLDLTVGVQEGDWAFVDQFGIPALDRIAGRFDTTLQITGTTDDPVVIGDVTSAPFHIHWLHLQKLRGQLRVERDQLVLTDLIGEWEDLKAHARIELPLVFNFLSTPDTPLDAPLLMRFTLPEGTDIGPLVHSTNAFTQCSGRAWAEVTIAGPLEHPYWHGNLQVRDGSFVLKRMSEIYREVEFDGTFVQDILTLNNIKGREGAKGSFQGDGTVTFNGLELETFAIDFVADRFLVASIPDLRVLVRTQDIRLSGVKVGPDSLIVPKFTGQAEVIKGRYTGQFTESSRVGDPLAATLAPDWMADVHAVAPPRSIRVVNRAMELYMSGDVDLIRDERGLYLRGTMDLDAGRFPVFNNDFNVVRGSLDFSQDVTLVPRVDMVAETKVRVRSALDPSSRLERITVYATGKINEPNVTFSSESGYSREGIERMLLGLNPYASEAQPYSGLRGASIAAGFNLLEREIATGLNVIDTFDIEQVERDQAGGANVSPLIGVGKYLGQDLYIKYAQGLSQSDRDLLIEYQINNHLLLQSEVRRRIDEQQGDTTYNLDLMYRFEY